MTAVSASRPVGVKVMVSQPLVMVTVNGPTRPKVLPSVAGLATRATLVAPGRSLLRSMATASGCQVTPGAVGWL